MAPQTPSGPFLGLLCEVRGITHRPKGGQQASLSVQKQHDRAEWVLPHGHSEVGSEADRASRLEAVRD